MGQGYHFICKQCHEKYSADVGCGIAQPMACEKAFSKIASGAYGAERKRLVEELSGIAVSGNLELYVCSSCNRWESTLDLTLYEPNEPDYVPEFTIGGETRWCGAPCVSDWELCQDYHVIKRYYHICTQCGRRMHKASEQETLNLTCPKCGTLNWIDSIIMWD